jgi:hypothetical protein
MSSVRTWRCGADLSVVEQGHPMSMRMRFANWFQVVRLLWSWIWIIAFFGIRFYDLHDILLKRNFHWLGPGATFCWWYFDWSECKVL